MSVLDKLNRFVKNPVKLDISRSRFPLNHSHKCTMKSGELVPILLQEVMPGDTFDLRVSNVTRMITPAVPVMDNAVLDTYFFFVPNRIACKGQNDWAKICGENFDSAWAPASEATLENTGNTFSLPGSTYHIDAGSALNHMGFPILDTSDGSVISAPPISMLPLNAYVKIWNEWFRDQNIQAPLEYNNNLTEVYDLGSRCLPVCKLHDYFTSALQSPQRGAPVMLPVGGLAPVSARTENHIKPGDQVASIRFSDFTPNGSSNGVYFGVDNALGIAQNGSFTNLVLDSTTVDNTGNAFVDSSIASVTQPSYPVTPVNLYADLANATAASVNQIRQAFAIQRLLERDARGGARYRELLKSHFGVTIPDATVQVPEYLGGKRIPINITQVLQTSSTDNTSPLGSTGAFSNTSFSDRPFIKSFNEFGYLIGVACIRTIQSYSQGISKLWTRNRRYDWYYPAFANLGEMPIYKRELYLKGISNTSLTNAVFGYQEAWAEYRYQPNFITGYLAPDLGDTLLTHWTYTNDFSALPVLNEDFIKQPSSQIDDTLVLSGSNYQFICDFYFDIKATRPMPLYSIPGLIDHH